MSRALLAPYTHHLEVGSTLRWRGRITQVIGNLIESEGPFCSVGETCNLVGHGEYLISVIIQQKVIIPEMGT